MSNPKVLYRPKTVIHCVHTKHLVVLCCVMSLSCCLIAINLQCKCSPSHAEDHTLQLFMKQLLQTQNMRHVCRCAITPSCWQTLTRRDLVPQTLCQASLWSWTNCCAIYTATTTKSCCCHITPRYLILSDHCPAVVFRCYIIVMQL